MPTNHPLRRVLAWTEEALCGLIAHCDTQYAPTGRDSIPAERLLDGGLFEAWASQKSSRPEEEPRQGKNPDADFKRQGRSNPTHQSTTDPEAKLYRKS